MVDSIATALLVLCWYSAGVRRVGLYSAVDKVYGEGLGCRRAYMILKEIAVLHARTGFMMAESCSARWSITAPQTDGVTENRNRSRERKHRSYFANRDIGKASYL